MTAWSTYPVARVTGLYEVMSILFLFVVPVYWWMPSVFSFCDRIVI